MQWNTEHLVFVFKLQGFPGPIGSIGYPGPRGVKVSEKNTCRSFLPCL